MTKLSESSRIKYVVVSNKSWAQVESKKGYKY